MKSFIINLDVPFNLDHTMDCGQTFRWNKLKDGSWLGVVDGDLLILKQENSELHVKSSAENLFGMELDEGIRYYLGLNDDLDTIKDNIVENLKLYGFYEQSVLTDKVFDLYRGLRILRQDPWEMLIEYLISARNNIPSIKRTIEKLCRLFPENKRQFDGIEYYVFPTLKQLKKLSLRELESINLAFRANWIYDTVRSVDPEKLYSLKGRSFNDKLEYLLTLKGVGYKIASCVMLFSMEEFSAFPVDVWIERVMFNLFNVKGSTKRVMETGRKYFGAFAGYAQEYLFKYFRTLQKGDK